MNAGSTARVVVVGSLNMDLCVRVPRLPQPGETVTGEALERSPGGKGANQAVAAQRLGAAVALVGMVGHDSFGADLTRRMAGDGLLLMGVSDFQRTMITGGVIIVAVVLDAYRRRLSLRLSAN